MPMPMPVSMRCVVGLAGLSTMLALPAAAFADDLTLLVHPPSVASPHPPLIVLMHGAGADEKDMIGLWKQLPPQVVVVSPRAPFGGSQGGWRWYRKGPTQDADLTVSRKIVDLVIDAAVKRYDADPTKIFLGGFSQGGVMKYEIALHEPGRFRGAVVLSGMLFPSALAGDPPGPNPTPFLIAHGTTDRTIGIASAESAEATLKARGIDVTVERFPSMAHTVGDAEMAAVSAWIETRMAPIAR